MTCILEAFSRFRVLVGCAVAVTACLSLASGAGAADKTSLDRGQGESVSYLVTPSPGTRSTLVRVPKRGRLLVKQVCSGSPAVYVTLGSSDSRISYFRQYSCTTFRPGYIVPGGEELRCVNKGGTAQSCSITGTLVKRMPAPPLRAVFLEP